MWFKTSRLSVKTQTWVRYHLRRNMRSIPRAFNLTRRATRKFLADPNEALLLCRMAWWVSVLSLAARCYSLPRALAIVAGSERKQAPPADVATQARLGRAIDQLLSADVFLFKPICWKRAAVLHRYLLRNGIATRIIFGVRNEADGKVAGHAWLEAEDGPILENAPPEYVVTYRFPSNEPRLDRDAQRRLQDVLR